MDETTWVNSQTADFDAGMASSTGPGLGASHAFRVGWQTLQYQLPALYVGGVRETVGLLAERGWNDSKLGLAMPRNFTEIGIPVIDFGTVTQDKVNAMKAEMYGVYTDGYAAARETTPADTPPPPPPPPGDKTPPGGNPPPGAPPEKSASVLPWAVGGAIVLSLGGLLWWAVTRR